jgi:hypothetical protein
MVSDAKKPKPAAASKYEIAEDWVALIKADVVNNPTWTEIVEKKYASKLEFTNEIENHFSCPVCQCLPSNPATTSCRHNMCNDCLAYAVKAADTKCALCRASLVEDDEETGEKRKLYELNGAFKKTLQAIFPGYDN